MGVIKRILSVFDRKSTIDSIKDEFIYDGISKGYAGGSLEHSNLMIVYSQDINIDEVEKILNYEKCCIKSCAISSISKSNLQELGADLIGGFNHIINFVHIGKDYDIYEIYRLLQIEAEYLIENNTYATLCTALMVGKDNPIVSGITSLIKGLGYAMPNHNIVANGVVAGNDLEISSVVQATIFLSSKYGQIMTGEVIKMK